MPDQDDAEVYPCVGVCMADPASGLCQGCGRPLAEPEPIDQNQENSAQTVSTVKVSN